MPRFTLEEVFGRPLKGACAVGGKSVNTIETVCLEVPHSRNVEVKKQAGYNELPANEQRRCYTIPGRFTRLTMQKFIANVL